MSSPPISWTRHFAKPGAVAFAMLFTMDSMARALLVTVIPLEALRVLGNARDMNVLYAVAGCGGVVASLFIPALVRRLRPRWVYTIGIVLLILAPGLMAIGTLPGLAAGMLMRAMAAACLLNMLNLYIMAYIRKRDLARSEPLRGFFSGAAWTIGPSLGVYLYESHVTGAVYALSAICATLLLGYFWWLRLEYGPALPPGTPARVNPLLSIRRYLQQPRLILAWLLNFGRETWWVMCFSAGPAYLVMVGHGEMAGPMGSAAMALLFLAPVMGWLGRRFGLRRLLMVAYLLCGVASGAAALLFSEPVLVVGALLVAALGAVMLDSVGVVPFLRAVRGRERPEMTMVFSLYRDMAGLLPPAFFAVLLSFFDLSSVFFATAAALMLCAWLARWIPRGM
jgi:MFS family permease